MTTLGAEPPAVAARQGGRSLRATVRAYVALTKPRIIELLLITTVPTMLLAADGWPPVTVMVSTVLGGALAAGSANALNCVADRDIDLIMRRTGSRPLVTDAVRPRQALIFGLTLGAVALAVMLAVNLLATVLTSVAIAYYVLVYTLGLKRRTPSNIVWGGAAGCMPVLIAWAAVTQTLDWSALVLFLIVFWWTPPHFWSLALRFRDDYAAAGVPMLPVVAGGDVVARRTLGHSWAMVSASVALWPVASMSWVYGVIAFVLGSVFLREAYLLRGRLRAGATGAALAPMRLFHLSITYLTVLFAVVGLDPFLRAWS